MATYLTSFSHTADTWAKLLANPEDRRKTLDPVVQALGGKMLGYWYAFGEHDGYVLFEAPDDVAAATLLVRVAAAGAFTKVSTTKLLTVEEGLAAMGASGSLPYRAPGAAG
jgi:uncharacterized protein with GYD domain